MKKVVIAGPPSALALVGRGVDGGVGVGGGIDGGSGVGGGVAVLVAGEDGAAVGEAVAALRAAGLEAAGWVGDPSAPAVREMALELFPGGEVVVDAR